MAFGTTAALVGMGLATAGSQVANSIIQSKAAKKASGIQQQSAQEANRFMERMWGQSQQFHSPYLGAGGGAASLLGQLMTPGGYRPPTAQQPITPSPVPTSGGAPMGRFPRIGVGPGAPPLMGGAMLTPWTQPMPPLVANTAAPWMGAGPQSPRQTPMRGGGSPMLGSMMLA